MAKNDSVEKDLTESHKKVGPNFILTVVCFS